ncbi:MAG: class I SAM-dependent methyltransferase [Oceanospirillaceae bacterium]|nr:class I SAM-dependent methyltransferase [Oceanospirillaceae bacterium]
MSSEDQKKWNTRYADQRRTIPSPPQDLIDIIDALPTGKLLDIACGEGAVALFMAGRADYSVTALDISDVGLINLKRFAQEQSVKLATLCADLEDTASLSQLTDYDCITVFRYKPTAALVRYLVSALADNGRLIISTFNMRHHLECGFSARFCLADEEFVNVDSRVSLLKLISASASPYTDTYIFQKNTLD